MAKRYERLYELPCGLYAAEAPVLIRSGALLLDRRSHNLLVQLKFYNLDPAAVTALMVLLDFPDQPGETLTRSYRNLYAAQDEAFGQDAAVLVPWRNVRSFRVRLKRVDFSDGTYWEDEGAAWKPLPKPKSLAEAYGGEELAQQYRIRYGTDCVYVPEDYGGLWQCTCGALNRGEEKNCRRCGRNGAAYFGVDITALRGECEARVLDESRDPVEVEPVRRKPDDSVLILPLLLLGVALIGCIIYYAPRVLNDILPIPTAAVATPVPTQAPVTVSPPPPPPTTPPPTDPPTEEELREQAYLEAVALLDAGAYSAARAALLELQDYRDSAELAQEAVYRKAVALLDFIRKYDEREIYALLTMDPRGTNRFSLTSEKALQLGSQTIDALKGACGLDDVDVIHADAPSGTLKSLATCVRELFQLVYGYRDSIACLDELAELTDYTRDFYMLCEAGDIAAASDWLVRYNGVFTGKDHWLQLLELYRPFCGDWSGFSGDFTLLPLTAGHNYACTSFNSRVIIVGDKATLRLLFTAGEGEYSVDLTADTGATNFLYELHGIYYLAQINGADHFAYLKYIDGQMVGSSEYNRAS